MNKIKKYSLAFLFSLSVTTSSYPIQSSTAKIISLASGAGVGALVAYQPDSNYVYGSIAGVCTAGLMYLITREFTPERKYERAKDLLYRAENGLFVRSQYLSDHVFFDAMQTAYATYDLPYAVAYYDLTDRLRWIKNARQLFDQACSENVTLSCLAQEYQSHADDLMRIVIEAIKRIKQTKEFSKQLKTYEKRRLAEKRLAIERRKAAARENQAWAQHRQADAQHRQANASGAW